jgi:hypothetical protein
MYCQDKSFSRPVCCDVWLGLEPFAQSGTPHIRSPGGNYPDRRPDENGEKRLPIRRDLPPLDPNCDVTGEADHGASGEEFIETGPPSPSEARGERDQTGYEANQRKETCEQRYDTVVSRQESPYPGVAQSNLCQKHGCLRCPKMN